MGGSEYQWRHLPSSTLAKDLKGVRAYWPVTRHLPTERRRGGEFQVHDGASICSFHCGGYILSLCCPNATTLAMESCCKATTSSKRHKRRPIPQAPAPLSPSEQLFDRVFLPRIIGGGAVPDSEFPWMAFFHKAPPFDTRRHRCHDERVSFFPPVDPPVVYTDQRPLPRVCNGVDRPKVAHDRVSLCSKHGQHRLRASRQQGNEPGPTYVPKHTPGST